MNKNLFQERYAILVLKQSTTSGVMFMNINSRLKCVHTPIVVALERSPVLHLTLAQKEEQASCVEHAQKDTNRISLVEIAFQEMKHVMSNCS